MHHRHPTFGQMDEICLRELAGLFRHPQSLFVTAFSTAYRTGSFDISRSACDGVADNHGCEFASSLTSTETHFGHHRPRSSSMKSSCRSSAAWRSEPPILPPLTSATYQCCPSCSTRSLPTRRSAASPSTAPLTPAYAMTPSLPAAPLQSPRLARTQNPASPTPPVRLHETKPSAKQSASDGPSGGDGLGITSAAA